MYWRIRKITPEMVARQYSVHAILIVSVFFNLILLSKVASAKALSGTQKDDMQRFAKSVTQHIFDANYLTFPESMTALCDAHSGELFGPASAKLRGDGTIPRDSDELKAMTRQLSESKSVSCIKFYGVDVGNSDAKGFVPIDVRMKVVVHDTTGVRPNAIKVHYVVGVATDQQTKQPRPVVLDCQMQPYDEKSDPTAAAVGASQN